jgi:hypothetical protein
VAVTGPGHVGTVACLTDALLENSRGGKPAADVTVVRTGPTLSAHGASSPARRRSAATASSMMSASGDHPLRTGKPYRGAGPAPS